MENESAGKWKVLLFTILFKSLMKIEHLKLGAMVHTCNPSMEAEARGLQVPGQPGLHS
jgi:hypothetical protein